MTSNVRSKTRGSVRGAGIEAIHAFELGVSVKMLGHVTATSEKLFERVAAEVRDDERDCIEGSGHVFEAARSREAHVERAL